MAQHEVQSPLPGTFYQKPAPDAPPYMQAGDTVKAGDVIGLVEVMKQFTQIQAEVKGKVIRYLMEHEAPVEPGDALLLIEIE